MKNKNYIFILLFFLIPLILIQGRTPRAEDENYSIIDGNNLISALTSSDYAVKKHAAEFNAIMGVGAVVTIPMGLAFKWTGDVVHARLVLLIFALIFWMSLLVCFNWFFSTFGQVNPQKISINKQAFWGFLALCFIQAIPGTYLAQSNALGEYPAAALTMLSFALLTVNRPTGALIAYSFALCAKLHFLIYLPVVLMAGALIKLHQAKQLVTVKSIMVRLSWALSLVLVLPGVMQLYKLIAFGPELFLSSWVSYLDFFIHRSGSGLGAHNPQFTPAVNEWPHYSWREKAYILLGLFSPVVASVYYAIKTKFSWASRFIAALSVCILAGGFHWWFISVVQWWRWSNYFVIVGYAIGIFSFITEVIRVQSKLDSKSIVVRASTAVLVGLALYVQIRQTIVGSWHNTTPLNLEQRTYMNWTAPGDRGPK